jgi:adenosylcobinamide-GDP ribazoletransferase
MLNFSAAFRFLTLARDASNPDARQAGLGVLCFPLAGLLLGLVLVVVNRVIAPYLSTEILALVLLMILILATGGHHLAGTQETFNTLPKITSPTNSVDHGHIHGLLAVLLVVFFKIHAIEATGESRAFSLLLTPLLARWSLLLFLFGSTTVADDAVRRVAESTRSWHLVAATVMSLGFGFYIAGASTLWVALCLSLFALLARSFLQRREGGISLANCGALIEISEALSFSLFASL